MRKTSIFHIISCVVIIIGAIYVFMHYIDGAFADNEARHNETFFLVATAAGLIYLSRSITVAIEEKQNAKAKDSQEKIKD